MQIPTVDETEKGGSRKEHGGKAALSGSKFNEELSPGPSTLHHGDWR